MVRLFMVGQLREQGYEVFEAANGEDAIALLSCRTPAVDQYPLHRHSARWRAKRLGRGRGISRGQPRNSGDLRFRSLSRTASDKYLTARFSPSRISLVTFSTPLMPGLPKSPY